MKRTEWFLRHFPAIEDNGRLPTIIERLSGTAVRLRDKLLNRKISNTAIENGKWTIKSEIGHLWDLEPLWTRRALNIINGDEYLEVTDLTNQKTFDARHDKKEFDYLIAGFERERIKLLDILNNVSEADLKKSALHPRLRTPMKLIDHVFFVAEHDDHHLAQITELMKLNQQ